MGLRDDDPRIVAVRSGWADLGSPTAGAEISVSPGALPDEHDAAGGVHKAVEGRGQPRLRRDRDDEVLVGGGPNQVDEVREALVEGDARTRQGCDGDLVADLVVVVGVRMRHVFSLLRHGDGQVSEHQGEWCLDSDGCVRGAQNG